MSEYTYTLGLPTVGVIRHQAVESLISVIGNGAVDAVSFVPRLPVQQARTRIVERCTTTHLLFIDDDMVYNPEHIEYLKENADKDIVCGLAYSRTDKESRGIAMRYDEDKGFFTFDARFQYGLPLPTGLTKVDGGTLAFALIKMTVFDKIGKEFNFGTNPPRGEDVDFYERVRKAGIEVYIDPRARVGHLTDRII